MFVCVCVFVCVFMFVCVSVCMCLCVHMLMHYGVLQVLNNRAHKPPAVSLPATKHHVIWCHVLCSALHIDEWS
jgi:hypothetical protein